MRTRKEQKRRQQRLGLELSRIGHLGYGEHANDWFLIVSFGDRGEGQNRVSGSQINAYDVFGMMHGYLNSSSWGIALQRLPKTADIQSSATGSSRS
jgi:hypothetical protein